MWCRKRLGSETHRWQWQCSSAADGCRHLQLDNNGWLAAGSTCGDIPISGSPRAWFCSWIEMWICYVALLAFVWMFSCIYWVMHGHVTAIRTGYFKWSNDPMIQIQWFKSQQANFGPTNEDSNHNKPIFRPTNEDPALKILLLLLAALSCFQAAFKLLSSCFQAVFW